MTRGEDYSFKTDIWSLGVLFYEICALEPPFMSRTHVGLFRKIQAGKVKKLPKVYGTNIHNLICAMLRVEQEKRINIDQVCKHSKVIKRIK
jgi:NIMA (never in mitosis gene a)-related kinase 1/4/5